MREEDKPAAWKQFVSDMKEIRKLAQAQKKAA